MRRGYDPGIRRHHAVPGQGFRLLIRQVAQDAGDLAGSDIHVHRDGAVGGEAALRDQADEADDFGTDAGGGGGFGHESAFSPSNRPRRA